MAIRHQIHSHYITHFLKDSHRQITPIIFLEVVSQSLSKCKKEVIIHYDFTKACDVGLVMHVDPRISSSVDAVRLENETVVINGIIQIHVIVGKADISVTKDLYWNLVRIDLKYVNVSNINLDILATVSGSAPSNTYLETHRLIIDKYGADYGVLWKHTENVAILMFDHMYYKVFENTDVAIYDVRKIIDTTKMSSST